MNEGLLLGAIFLFIYFLVVYSRNALQSRKIDKSIKNEILDYNEIEYVFFEEVKTGKYVYKLLKIYSPYDLMMIKSFFISENIPYYVEYEHFMKVYPFVHGENYNNTNIYILDEDYDDAIFIINSFIKSKNLDEHKIRYAFRGMLEFLIMNWVITPPQNFVGFEVNYKKQ